MMNIARSQKKKRSGTSAPFAFLALAGLLCFGIPGSAQTGVSQNAPPQDTDTTRGQLASMNEFLEAHPEMSEQLRKDPTLVNNQEFVENHPALQQYLQQHPEVHEEIQENPNAFMRQEQRFDHREDMQGQGNRLAATDEFFEAHPEIAEQIRKDPSLVNNPQFVQEHPALQQFLQQHPEVREQFQANPSAFMQQEQRFDRREDRMGLAATDRFFDSHPEIAEQLRKDPSLVNNQKFVQEHPALQQYLQQHPEVRDEFQENPNAFMRQEQRFDRREDRMGLAATDRFFDSHPEIAEQLRKDPSLVNNQKFVQEHPALQQYLQQHPEVRDDFKENPNAFMRQEQRFDRREDLPGQPGHMATTDRFLDSHPEISEQLQKDPSLVNNQHFVQGHPALQQYLQEHSEIRQQFQQNPSAFMQQQQRFEQREDGQPETFGQFLGSHAGIAHQLSQNPSLLNSKEYLEDHPDLQQYLKAHPEAKQEFSENPSAFISALQSGTSMPGTASTPSTKSSGTAAKPKQ